MINRDNKYKLLLFTIIIFILLSPLTTILTIGKWVYALLFLFMIYAVSMNIKSPRHANWILPLLGLIAIVFYLIGNHVVILKLFSELSLLAYSLYAILLFSRNIYMPGYHYSDHIYGSICVYLLIGMSYATIYMIISLLLPGALVFQPSALPLSNPIDFYYFSFITLTTVGFGDIIANHDLVKAVIMIESTTGLFYIAVLVASLSNTFKSNSTR